MRTTHFLRSLCALAACALSQAAFAQQAILTTAPTLPSKGQVITRHLLVVTTFDDGPVQGEDITFVNSVSYGLSGSLAAQVDLPYLFRDVEGTTDGDIDTSGLLDGEVSLKWRVWKNDFGPVDTARLAVVAGTTVPFGADRFSSDSFDPFVGLAYMYIQGRHGLGVSANYLFTTGSTEGPALLPGDSLADLLEVDAAYLFRIAPSEYGEDFAASWYAVLELNMLYETNGDSEAFIAPGLLYEAPRFAVEATVQVPIAQDLHSRPDRGLVVTLGLRLLF
jgi:hypothetical protein